MPEKHIGKVVQVMGPVLDIRFADGELPELLNAIELQNNGKPLIVERGALHCYGRHRWPCARCRSRGYRRADQGSRWRCVPWPCVQPAG